MILLSTTVLYVASVEQTVLFYQQAFGFRLKHHDTNYDYAELLTADDRVLGIVSAATMVGLLPHQANTVIKALCASDPASFQIGFKTDNLEKAYAQALDAGATAVLPPTSMPWGQQLGYIRDLNGVLVELCQ